MAKKINLKDIAMNVAATGAGAVGASFVEKIPMVAKQSPLIKGLLKIGLGVLIPHFLGKGKKSAIIESAGNGAVAVGSMQLANATVFKAAPLSISGIDGFATLGYGDEYSRILDNASPVVTAQADKVSGLGDNPYMV